MIWPRLRTVGHAIGYLPVNYPSAPFCECRPPLSLVRQAFRFVGPGDFFVRLSRVHPSPAMEDPPLV